MQEIPNKFRNLKKFILEVNPTNENVIWFQDVSFEEFIIQAKINKAYNYSNQKIYDDIITTMKIDQSLSSEVARKLMLYVEYFSKVL